MSRKRIKKKVAKTPDVKEMKKLRQRIQKAIIDTDEAVAEIKDLDPDKVLEDFQDIS